MEIHKIGQIGENPVCFQSVKYFVGQINGLPRFQLVLAKVHDVELLFLPVGDLSFP